MQFTVTVVGVEIAFLADFVANGLVGVEIANTFFFVANTFFFVETVSRPSHLHQLVSTNERRFHIL